MTLSALGIFSAAGAGGVVAGSYDLLETQILGSSQNSITFSSLGTYASDYKHLQIRVTTRVAAASTGATLTFRLNGDTGSNYSNHELTGNGSSVTSYGEANVTRGFFGVSPGSSSTANVFGSTVFDLLDPFSTTKNKTSRSLGGQTSGNFVYLYSSSHRSTAATTSIQIFHVSGSDFVTGTRMSLYGSKG
jgi:hypothetical protein